MKQLAAGRRGSTRLRRRRPAARRGPGCAAPGARAPRRRAERVRGDVPRRPLPRPGWSSEFAVFTDPLNGIGRFDDSVPILMMPVRLETRFKKSGAARRRRQLWVRVYPDDCWIDTFDSGADHVGVSRTPGATGSRSGRRGESRTRSAARGGRWRRPTARAGRPGSCEQYQPATSRPSRPSREPQDVILTIAVETALPAAEAAAVAAFWTAVWRADGDAGATAAARAAPRRRGRCRSRRASSWRRRRPPTSTRRCAVGVAKPDVAVSVAFVELPAADTKQAAWARPPRANVLPDRFIFIGYETSRRRLTGRGRGPSRAVAADPRPRSRRRRGRARCGTTRTATSSFPTSCYGWRTSSEPCPSAWVSSST